jgi:hypothetical protein
MANAHDMVMNGVYQGSSPHDERRVLQPGSLRRVVARLGWRIEEQVGAGLVVGALVRKFVVDINGSNPTSGINASW